MVAPVLLFILLGIIQCGLTLNNYLVLTEGVSTGARQLAIGRAISTPYTSTTSAITSAMPNLSAASVTIATWVNGTACDTDASCATALTNTGGGGGAATVTATYPCDLNIMGIDFAPNCTLSSTTSDLVE